MFSRIFLECMKNISRIFRKCTWKVLKNILGTFIEYETQSTFNVHRMYPEYIKCVLVIFLEYLNIPTRASMNII